MDTPTDTQCRHTFVASNGRRARCPFLASFDGYCKDHHPALAKPVTLARQSENNRILQRKQSVAFAQECIQAVMLIAEGTDNPEAVARQVLKKYGRWEA